MDISGNEIWSAVKVKWNVNRKEHGWNDLQQGVEAFDVSPFRCVKTLIYTQSFFQVLAKSVYVGCRNT